MISYGPDLNQDRIARIPILFGYEPFFIYLSAVARDKQTPPNLAVLK